MDRLAAAVDELVDADPTDTPDVQLLDDFVRLDVQIRRLEGLRLRRLEQLDRRGAALVDHGSTRAWLTAATRCGWRAASRSIWLARHLADVLPEMSQALVDGAVRVDHARAAAALRKPAGDAAMVRMDGPLTEHARGCAPDEFRCLVRTFRHQLDPEAIVRDERDAYDGRELSMASTFGGVGVGSWTLDPASHEIVLTAIQAAAAPVPKDGRSARQRHADGLIEVCRFFSKHATGEGVAATRAGVPPQVTVLVTWETLTRAPAPRPRQPATAPASPVNRLANWRARPPCRASSPAR